MRKVIILSSFFLFVFAFSIDIYAQCAMCKAVVETNLEGGMNKIGSGLNTGILYLMAVPYISVLLFGIFWYFQNKKMK
tara:strand:+ start:16 stop:249 length:234 start_codon:yes stop_codon:yes gene_type:complete